jgi:hypothetical protein
MVQTIEAKHQRGGTGKTLKKDQTGNTIKKYKTSIKQY